MPLAVTRRRTLLGLDLGETEFCWNSAVWLNDIRCLQFMISYRGNLCGLFTASFLRSVRFGESSRHGRQRLGDCRHGEARVAHRVSVNADWRERFGVDEATVTNQKGPR